MAVLDCVGLAGKESTDKLMTRLQGLLVSVTRALA